MSATHEVLIEWKDTKDTEHVTVAYPLDIREDDDYIFFYFNDREDMVDAMREDTAHDFVIKTIFDY